MAPLIFDLLTYSSGCPSLRNTGVLLTCVRPTGDRCLSLERLLPSSLCGLLLASCKPLLEYRLFYEIYANLPNLSLGVPIPLAFLRFSPWHLPAPSRLCNLCFIIRLLSRLAFASLACHSLSP